LSFRWLLIKAEIKKIDVLIKLIHDSFVLKGVGSFKFEIFNPSQSSRRKNLTPGYFYLRFDKEMEEKAKEIIEVIDRLAGFKILRNQSENAPVFLSDKEIEQLKESSKQYEISVRNRKIEKESGAINRADVVQEEIRNNNSTSSTSPLQSGGREKRGASPHFMNFMDILPGEKVLKVFIDDQPKWKDKLLLSTRTYIKQNVFFFECFNRLVRVVFSDKPNFRVKEE